MSELLAPQTSAFLSSCYNELEEHTRRLRPRPIDFSVFDNIESGVMEVCQASLTLIERGYRRTAKPVTTDIARMTIRFVQHEDRIATVEEIRGSDRVPEEDYESILDAIGCLEAESRLAHSLAKQHEGQSERCPAYIFSDSNGEPFAYQKGNGYASAFTWRDGYLQTDEGPKWVPQNAIIRPLYEDGHNPRLKYADQPLVLSLKPRIRTAHFLRFIAASWLPEHIAYQSAQYVGQRFHEQTDAREAAVLSADRLEAWVKPLLTQARLID